MLSGRCSIQLLYKFFFQKKRQTENIDTKEETNELADDFGFSVAGVNLNLHSKRYAYVAGVRHLRDET